MFYIKLALRNLVKGKKRSFLTMFTIVLGMTALILADGFVSYSLWGFRESIINGGIGHFQIYRKGFLRYGEEKPFDYMITGHKKIIRELSIIPGIKLISPRLSFRGIVSSADRSAIISGTAGNPDDEKMFSTFTTLNEGENLSDTNPLGIMIGSGVARRISGKAGDPCTVIVSMKGGGVNALDFNISGVIQSHNEEMDNVYALAGLKTIQTLLNVSNSIDTLTVMLAKTENMKEAEASIGSYCEKTGLEYRRWDQIAPYYYPAKDFYSSAMNIAMIVIFAIVIFAVANTMTMALFERIREIGTIRALGTTQPGVMRIFLSEGLLIGIFGSLAGIVCGIMIAWIVNASGGIQIPPPPGSAKGYRAMIVPQIWSCLSFFMMFLCVTAAAVIYPAFKAARMAVADALRWI